MALPTQIDKRHEVDAKGGASGLWRRGGRVPALQAGRKRRWLELAGCALAVVFALCRDTAASDFSSRFGVVMIDDKTEARLGAFPYDRSIVAQAVNACAERGAKAVVLKFFFDLPKSPAGDQALCEAMGRVPVALQARLEAADGKRQPVPDKFAVDRNLPVAVRGDRGWIPLPMLLEKAAACGFVDFDSPRIPMIEGYGDAVFRSLVVCALELAFDTPAVFSANQIRLGSRVLPVDARNVFQADLSRPEPIPAISFVDLMEGRVPAEAIRNRVMIIGHNSAKTPKTAPALGGQGIHAFFVQCVAAIVASLKVEAAEPKS